MHFSLILSIEQIDAFHKINSNLIIIICKKVASVKK